MILANGNTVTTMLFAKSAIENLHSLGCFDVVDEEAWAHLGVLRLKDAFLLKSAQEAADKLSGIVKKVWFDNGAGGYFVDILLPDACWSQMLFNPNKPGVAPVLHGGC